MNQYQRLRRFVANLISGQALMLLLVPPFLALSYVSYTISNERLPYGDTMWRVLLVLRYRFVDVQQKF